MNADRSNYTYIVPYINHCKNLLIQIIFIMILLFCFKKLTLKINTQSLLNLKCDEYLFTMV